MATIQLKTTPIRYESQNKAQRTWRSNNPEKQREYLLKYRYGMSVEEYQIRLYSQNGLCAVCAEPGYGKPLLVDHSHKTGTVRGLLCRKCNTAEGMLRDNIQNLIKYLEMTNG